MDEGISLGEVGPMAGAPWSDSDLELLKKLGILPNGIPQQGDSGERAPVTFGSGAPLGGGPMDWGKIKGTTSGSGPGTTAGLGAGSGSMDTGSVSSAAFSYGGSGGSFSSGPQDPHDRPQKFGSISGGGSGPAGAMPSLDVSKLGPVEYEETIPDFIFPAYKSQRNPWSDAAKQWGGAQMARNYIEHMLRRGR